jgi:hypothetical protein
LRFVIEQATLNRGGKAAGIPDELPEVRALKSDTFPIESIAGCKSFELVWDHYAAYLVTEELAGTGGSLDDEILICLDHLIDIASTKPPKVSRINLVR